MIRGRDLRFYSLESGTTHAVRPSTGICVRLRHKVRQILLRYALTPHFYPGFLSPRVRQASNLHVGNTTHVACWCRQFALCVAKIDLIISPRPDPHKTKMPFAAFTRLKHIYIHNTHACTWYNARLPQAVSIPCWTEHYTERFGRWNHAGCAVRWWPLTRW